MTNLHFAQISDIHFSVLGDQYDMLSSQAADFLAAIVTNLNQIEELDFVLVVGQLPLLAHYPSHVAHCHSEHPEQQRHRGQPRHRCCWNRRRFAGCPQQCSS